MNDRSLISLPTIDHDYGSHPSEQALSVASGIPKGPDLLVRSGVCPSCVSSVPKKKSRPKSRKHKPRDHLLGSAENSKPRSIFESPTNITTVQQVMMVNDTHSGLSIPQVTRQVLYSCARCNVIYLKKIQFLNNPSPKPEKFVLTLMCPVLQQDVATQTEEPDEIPAINVLELKEQLLVTQEIKQEDNGGSASAYGGSSPVRGIKHRVKKGEKNGSKRCRKGITRRDDSNSCVVKIEEDIEEIVEPEADEPALCEPIKIVTDCGEIGFQCSVCSKQYSKLQNCEIHMSLHTKSPQTTTCEICGRVCVHPFSYHKHMLTHTEKNYECETCGAKFAMNEHYQKHLFTHRGRHPHQCKFCGRLFSVIWSLDKHIAGIHLGEYEYSCVHCGRGFVLFDCYKLHLRGHGVQFTADSTE